MKHSIEINKLNKFLSIGDTLTLLDVRRRTDYEATPQKIAGAVWRDPEKIDTFRIVGGRLSAELDGHWNRV